MTVDARSRDDCFAHVHSARGVMTFGLVVTLPPRIDLHELASAMLIFGLTGGISSGKTTVSGMLAEFNCPIVDADVLARTGRYMHIYTLAP